MGDGPDGKLNWHTACDIETCLQVAATDNAVIIRSSVNPGATVTLTRSEWQTFLTGAKDGLFDEL